MGRRMVSFLRVIRLLLITFRFLTVCSVSFLFALEKFCFKYPLSLQASLPPALSLRAFSLSFKLLPFLFCLSLPSLTPSLHFP